MKMYSTLNWYTPLFNFYLCDSVAEGLGIANIPIKAKFLGSTNYKNGLKELHYKGNIRNEKGTARNGKDIQNDQ